MTQNKFVTKTLLIFHKSLGMPIMPAKWLMYVEMMKKLSMFVSHMYIVVMHLAAVSSVSYMYQHDILIGLSDFNQGLTCQVIKAHRVP